MTNTAIVKGMFEAFNRGDIAHVLDNLTDDIEWIVPGGESIPFAGRYTGRGGVAGFFNKLSETSDTDPLVIQRYVEQGDTVVALGASTARSKPQQKQSTTSFAMVFTLTGGKVANFQEYFDSAAVAASYTGGSQAARN